ncbi:MAG: monovalent cation/H+ antiporter subunit D family protein, partial [Deltaproteobacteria bacterium]|nr:monovalent cation/H+ antiporter subunit D family protein [Deltaproteobacteria bacterium]
FLPITYDAFFSSGPNFDTSTRLSEAHICAVVPLVVTAAISFLLFLHPGFFLELARMTARAVMGG